MEWERRPKSDEPVNEQRALTDDDGRRWVGSVMSGRFGGGEENAEVLFVCEDQPSEMKRVSDLGVPARDADDHWRGLPDAQVEETFRRSRRA
jgi:hypothetical protein